MAHTHPDNEAIMRDAYRSAMRVYDRISTGPTHKLTMEEIRAHSAAVYATEETNRLGVRGVGMDLRALDAESDRVKASAEKWRARKREREAEERADPIGTAKRQLAYVRDKLDASDGCMVFVPLDRVNEQARAVLRHQFDDTVETKVFFVIK